MIKIEQKPAQKHDEQRLQAKCFLWFWNELPEYRGQLLHVNNKPINGALGVVPGVSDFIFIGRGFVSFIELKTPIGKQSKEQKAFQVLVSDYAHKYYIIRDFENFKTLITWLIEQ